jgi:hypothetical protein
MSAHKSAKEQMNLTRLLDAAIPMLCHPKAIGLPDALGLLDALHVSKHLCENRLLAKVGQEAIRLLRDAQASAVKRAEEKQVEAQEQDQEEKSEEGDEQEVAAANDGDEQEVAAAKDGDKASQDNEREQELITSTEIAELMSAPMRLATDYAEHISEHKRQLTKLAKVVLPAVCGYADGTAATKLLARLGVGAEESAKMFGTVNSKETQAVVKSSSSDTNAETEAPSVSAHIVKEDFAVKSDEEEEAIYTAVLGPPIGLVPGPLPLPQQGFLPQVIGDDDGAEADAHFVLGPSGTQSYSRVCSSTKARINPKPTVAGTDQFIEPDPVVESWSELRQILHPPPR